MYIFVYIIYDLVINVKENRTEPDQRAGLFYLILTSQNQITNPVY